MGEGRGAVQVTVRYDMPAHNINATPIAPPLVVGTIYSPGSLRRALRLRAGAVDVLELRVDHFADASDELLRAARDLPAPLIVTVRHPREGGAGELGAERRRELYWEFLHLAKYVDVELQSLRSFDVVLAGAQHAGAQAIVSDHHFRATPSLKVLQERWARARSFCGGTMQADIVKVAARVETPADLARLIAIFGFAQGASVSVMGMGPLGKVSRLLCARLGSCLNYGYLDRPQVPGQWEAVRLKERLAELFEE
ncbi:MAG TPA: type I 3-dehydroquinate dehydratase [Chthoniobacteraceae bacterium]|jgi:3-dehydroquinate dehydratase-1|nr:type I 3-dehydroquinate dehydratase [Chthoniobacteraceae bacterium]